MNLGAAKIRATCIVSSSAYGSNNLRLHTLEKKSSDELTNSSRTDLSTPGNGGRHVLGYRALQAQQGITNIYCYVHVHSKVFTL